MAYKNIIIPTVVWILLFMHQQSIAASAWDCRPNADGVGWSCAQAGGLFDAPIKSVQTTPKPVIGGKEIDIGPNERVAEDGLIFETVPRPLRWINPERLAPSGLWSHCGSYEFDAHRLAREEAQKAPNRSQANTSIVSDHVELIRTDDIAHFVGKVAITRADQRIQGDLITFDEQENTVRVVGDVAYKETGLLFNNGSEAFFNLNDDSGSVDAANFVLDTVPSRGYASHAEVENAFITHFTDLDYTSCRPGNQDWQLKAEQLTINQDTGIGEARHATVEFFGVPLFYSPYYSFPLDDRRKSGFLAPTFGISDEDGYDLSVPYYWDIAANYDATITPRIISKRGIQLGGEFRYLFNNNDGQVIAEFLPGDDIRGDDRGLFSLQHDSRFSANLTGLLDLNYVSDSDYFEDFGQTIAETSATNIQRLAELNYRDEYSRAQARLQYLQSVNDAVAEDDTAFHRLPQLTYAYDRDDRAFGLSHHLDSEFVYFDHSSNARESGARVDLKPGISLPISTLGWFVTPRLDYRYTYYELDTQGDLEDDQFERSLPIFSVDSGLFLEKNTNLFGQNYLQTLEPRLFYLYVPFENQDDFPNFDTSEFDFSFAQLFRDNRFNNADRQGEANQLSYALTSRLLNDASGREVVSASIGQILFFEERDVVLVDQDEDDDSTSPVIGEVSWNITQHLRSRYTIQYNTHDDFTDRNEFRLRYSRDNSHILNFDYRQRSGIVEETDISFRWKLLPQWHVIGRNQYSLRDNHVIENLAGLEYESCCWVGRVLAVHTVEDISDIDNDGDSEGETSLFFQIELKGFASIGDKITDRIQEGVINYESYKN